MGSTSGGTQQFECNCGGLGKEVFLEFTTPRKATYRMDTFGSSFDTVLYIIDSECNQQLACDDDSQNVQSEFYFKRHAGSPLSVVVDGFTPDQEGNYTLHIDEIGLVINEIDYDQGDDDDAEFIEIYNGGQQEVDLSEIIIAFKNEAGTVYGLYALADAGDVLEAGKTLVIGEASVLAGLPGDALSLELDPAGIQDGPAGMDLLVSFVEDDDFNLDRAFYAGPVDWHNDKDEFAPADPGPNVGLSLCPNGEDTDTPSDDFQVQSPTPGAPNGC
jgi:hypothetical protein